MGGTGREGVALCLSGGGFRAALFHLGALRRLSELGILRDLRWLSSVSGGSIMAGHLAERMVKAPPPAGLAFEDWTQEVAEPFHRFVAQDLRTVPVLAHLAWNWLWPQFRVRQLERRYRKRLTGLRVRDLPEAPEFLLCATDLTFGVNWIFSRDRVGDYRAGYVRGGTEWPLARAVAASACFPPVFGPMRAPAGPDEYQGGDYRGDDRRTLLSGVALSDGGVYDNMGLEPVWTRARHVLVSDCGAPFDFVLGRNPLSRLLRYTSVVTSQTQALRTRMLMADFHADDPCKRYDGAYWHLSSGFTDERKQALPDGGGYSEALVTEVIARIRTDLDAFTIPEMSVLENHGYFSTDYSIRHNSPDLAAPAAPAPKAPYPDWMDEAKVRRALRSSHKRFSLKRFVATTFRRQVK